MEIFLPEETIDIRAYKFDQWFDLSAMFKDVINRPFFPVGMLAMTQA